MWRQTYWGEAGRSGDYVQWVTYQHTWKPDRETEVPFPDQNGLDNLGKTGWELVTMTSDQVSLVTRVSPQGDSYAQYTTLLLMFKRPLG